MFKANYRIILLILPYAISGIPVTAGKLTFSGNQRKIISVSPDKTSGLNNVYVAETVEGISITYTTTQDSQPRWFRFSNLGGGYAEEITDISYSEKTSTLQKVTGDSGYIIEDGTERIYFWIVNYSNHVFSIEQMSPSEEQECESTILNVDAHGAPIHYYSINGRQLVLDRELKLYYDNLIWEDETMQFQQHEVVDNLTHLGHNITLIPPVYCSTTFTITGDRFLKEWGKEISYESNLYEPKSVDCKTEAISDNSQDENDNLIDTGEDDTLGGSAPATIKFNAYVTDAVIHHEWQMSYDEDFENILYRFNQQDLEYTFTEQGITYLRYIGSNSDGSCETFSDVYTVNIGASDLRIPNAFSPGDDGINDVWKVGYRSLLNFECWIFDRNGNQLYHFDKPNGGWDGKYKGKYVKPGVYYYVINATGSDGKKYKKSGDINILRYKSTTGGSNTPDTPVE